MFELWKLRAKHTAERLLIRARHWLFWWPWLRDKLATDELRQLDQLYKAMSAEEMERFKRARGSGRTALLKIYMEKYGIE